MKPGQTAWRAQPEQMTEMSGMDRVIGTAAWTERLKRAAQLEETI